MIKTIAKTLVGIVRAKFFQIRTGKKVYIGKHCALKGKQNIALEDSVTIRPYVQIWSGGGYSKNRARL